MGPQWLCTVGDIHSLACNMRFITLSPPYTLGRTEFALEEHLQYLTPTGALERSLLQSMYTIFCSISVDRRI